MGETIVAKLDYPRDEEWAYLLETNPREYLIKIGRSLQTENRFFVDYRFLKLLNWYISPENTAGRSTSVLKQGEVLKRARVYDKSKDNEIATKGARFKGYGPEGSGAPKVGTAVPAGRANPDHIIYLYAASDEETAIAEVTPPIESDVSVADILVKTDLFVVCFLNLSAVTSGEDSPLKRWIRNFVIEIMRVFNAPPRDDRDYLLCQFISEYFKVLGFDGIAFRSSKVKKDTEPQNGINYTIFDKNSCSVVASNLFYVRNHTYELRKQLGTGFYEPFEG